MANDDWCQGQFARVPTSVFTDPKFRKLGAGAVRAYLTIAAHADRTGRPWIGCRKLASMSGIGVRNVDSRGVQPLVDAGFVKRDGLQDGTSRYRLICPVSATADGGATASVGATADVGATANVGASATASVGASAHASVDDTYPLSNPLTEKSAALGGADAPGGFAASSFEAEGVPTSTTPTASITPSDQPPAPTAESLAAAAAAQLAEYPPEQRPLISLLAWFGYGKPGERSPSTHWRNLTPSATNWFHPALLARDEDWQACRDDATEVQVAAWAWWHLSHLRARHGLPVTKPVSNALMGKRGTPGVVTTIIAERGVPETIKLVTAACQCVDEILATSEPKYRPALDAGFFRHKTTIRAAERFMQGGADSVVDQMEQQLGAYLT